MTRKIMGGLQNGADKPPARRQPKTSAPNCWPRQKPSTSSPTIPPVRLLGLSHAALLLCPDQAEVPSALARRGFLHLAAGAAALPALSRIAWAQAYPSRPVRIIVTFAVGSA